MSEVQQGPQQQDPLTELADELDLHFADAHREGMDAVRLATHLLRRYRRADEMQEPVS